MRKYIWITLMLMFCALDAHANVITVENFYSPDSVSIEHLENFRSEVVNGINNADGGLLQARTVTPEKLTENADVTIFRKEAFNDWIYTGLLPATSATLASNISLGTGYVDGQRIKKDVTSHTYTASKWTFVDLKFDGTYVYTELNIGDADPAITSGTIRVARVATDGTSITAVRDDRRLALTLDNAQEDYYRNGLRMKNQGITTDIIEIMPGVAYWGTVRTKKTTITTLNLATAGDWVPGGGSQSNSTMGYVVMNNAGAIKLTTVAPGYVDTAGNTVGQRRYTLVGGNYYRVLAWFYMSNTKDPATYGLAGDCVNPWGWGNYQGDMESLQSHFISSDYAMTDAKMTLLPDSRVTFYAPSGVPVDLRASTTGWCASSGYGFQGAIALDGVILKQANAQTGSTDSTAPSLSQGSVFINWTTPELEAGLHYVDVYVKQPDENDLVIDDSTTIVRVK